MERDESQREIKMKMISKRKYALFFFIDYSLAFSIVIEYFIFFRGVLLYSRKGRCGDLYYIISL